jgi:hypothetical protein
MEFVDGGGLADAGVAGHQHQLRRATQGNAVKGGEQDLDLALTPIQLLWNQESVWRVVFAERKVIDAA